MCPAFVETAGRAPQSRLCRLSPGPSLSCFGDRRVVCAGCCFGFARVLFVEGLCGCLFWLCADIDESFCRVFFFFVCFGFVPVWTIVGRGVVFFWAEVLALLLWLYTRSDYSLQSGCAGFCGCAGFGCAGFCFGFALVWTIVCRGVVLGFVLALRWYWR